MLDPVHFVGFAKELDLDIVRFVRELQNHVYHDRVRQDFLSGVRSGVNGTPLSPLTDFVMTDRGNSRH